jgi:hypothetical protein
LTQGIGRAEHASGNEAGYHSEQCYHDCLLHSRSQRTSTTTVSFLPFPIKKKNKKRRDFSRQERILGGTVHNLQSRRSPRPPSETVPFRFRQGKRRYGKMSRRILP